MSLSLDVLAFGAHPDDVELMCAGTLIKLSREGYKVGVVSLTAGEMGTRGTVQIRRKEFENSSQIMGLSANEILDIPDSKVQVTEVNRNKVISAIRKYRPKIVFAPYWKTRHPDHSHCSSLVREASFYSGLINISTGQEKFRPDKTIYYMELYDFDPSFIVDVSDSFDDKIKAMKAYESQFYSENNKETGNEATYIATKEFLQSIITRGQYWGNKIGSAYGEPFYVREPIKVNDPVKLFSDHHFSGLL